MSEVNTIEIELGNIGNEAQAKKIKRVLDGQTYFNFEVHYACSANNWPVFVTAEADEDERVWAVGMLMHIMACEL